MLDLVSCSGQKGLDIIKLEFILKDLHAEPISFFTILSKLNSSA